MDKCPRCDQEYKSIQGHTTLKMIRGRYGFGEVDSTNQIVVCEPCGNAVTKCITPFGKHEFVETMVLDYLTTTTQHKIVDKCNRCNTFSDTPHW